MSTLIKPDHVLVLRTVAANRVSHSGFVWPREGLVEAPDWNPKAVCGGGLHGWLWGEGNGSLGNFNDDAIWQIVSVKAEDIVNLDEKVKFPRGEVVASGNRLEITNMLQANAPGRRVIGAVVTAGYNGTAVAGDGGTATAGPYGTATAGDGGTAVADDRGTATAGYNGTIELVRWDTDARRYRRVVGYVGEDGIEANTPYCLDPEGKLVKKSNLSAETPSTELPL